ncbi:MAG: hypothetical protein U0163_20520 [Gemmatimonadaceae bacterium]
MAPAIDGCVGADDGIDTTRIKTHCRPPRRSLRRERTEGVDLTRAAFGFHDLARTNHAAGGGWQEKRQVVDLIVNIRSAVDIRMTVRPIQLACVNHETNELFFDNAESS